MRQGRKAKAGEDSWKVREKALKAKSNVLVGASIPTPQLTHTARERALAAARPSDGRPGSYCMSRLD